jgi:hypothetical protein
MSVIVASSWETVRATRVAGWRVSRSYRGEVL